MTKDELRQRFPEIVLAEHVPELYRSMWFVVQNVLGPIIHHTIWQRDCRDMWLGFRNRQLQPQGQAKGGGMASTSADIAWWFR